MLDTTSVNTSAELRRMMVDCQIRTFDVTNTDVLDAMQDCPRELFVGDNNAGIAYSDACLVVSGESETRRLLAPMVLARLLQNCELTGICRVLDIAGASGYSAAIIAKLAGEVVALESDAGFTRAAAANFAKLGLRNASAVTGDMTVPKAERGLFDVILVNGAVEAGLEGLFASLKPGGRLLTISRVGGRAPKAIRYDFIGGAIGSRPLFEANASMLTKFRAAQGFAF
jgi:protein-L-isoaspartate(D-aspartate) O-methyltransferase